MRDPTYAAFSALDPFFNIVRQGLAGLVDGDHYFDTIAPDAVFEFRYRFPGWPTKVVGREALMALYAGYGERMALHGADALVLNISQTPGVVILEYEVQGNAVGSGKLYENRFISVVTIDDRKIVGWRDYMDSLAAMSSLAAMILVHREPPRHGPRFTISLKRHFSDLTASAYVHFAPDAVTGYV
jgi:ketosteroid isomerase-like protein